MKQIYLDNSATTPLCAPAIDAMRQAIEHYGNPSSLHPLGQAAHTVLEHARRDVAATLGLRRPPEPGQLIFTSCGSEADNLAILGTAYAKSRRRGGRVITTDSEHPGVENAMRALEKDGFEVIRIPTRGGVLDMERLNDALNSSVFLVSLMAVNNETGAAYDLETAFSLVKAYNDTIVTHTDAVQGYLKRPLNTTSLKADMITVSAHKIQGPKGVGALYVSPAALKRRDLSPVLFGGGQESGFRSGTENLIGIAGFAAAAKCGFEHMQRDIAHMRALRALAIEQLSALPVQLNIPHGSCAPHILNLTLPDIRSETMLHALSAHRICVSAGSACSSHSKSISAALTAFGLSPAQIECSIRVSFGPQNTEDDVTALTHALSAEIERLVKIHR